MFTVSHNAYVDFGATVHIVLHKSILCNGKDPMNTLIVTAGTETSREKSQGKCVVRFSSETKMDKLNRVLHVPKVAHNLVLVSGL